ncbi:Aldo/keto reductase [Fistulina hepatica ATCC 64428]|uniref:Aldo/keto reductase n=1 Tax=Fistulina hepatica ATCC 64428 TaxID=1128425 RepID=A0A0D7ANS6_9AGAR|nr:Aldo/keto reductase [Fistulina hepatica ATCC 64428]
MSSQVSYRRLGNSGLRVSVPIPWVIEEEEAHEVLKAAWDRGVNTVDTANVYSNGKSEVIIGNFIKKYDIPRHKFIIATKCYAIVSEQIGEVSFVNEQKKYDNKNYVNQFGLSRAAIFNAVEQLLDL